MSDSIGPASVRSDAYYLLAELFERAELEELLDAQTGVLLGIALSDLLREGWTILAPPPKGQVHFNQLPPPLSKEELAELERRWEEAYKANPAPKIITSRPEYADVATELRRVFMRKPRWSW